MVTEQNVLDAVAECNQERTKTFAEFIATVFKDKLVEIYLGDSYEEVSTEQISQSYPAVFCGKVIAAYRECLVISAAYIPDGARHPSFGNLVFISERAIRGLTEVDGQGIMEDMFLRSKESLEIKYLHDHGKALINEKLKRR